MKAREIILRPLITEKTTVMQERENTVCFEVNRRANKIQVRKAVEELFDVRVTEVNIVNRKGKPMMRYGRVVAHRPALDRLARGLADQRGHRRRGVARPRLGVEVRDRQPGEDRDHRDHDHQLGQGEAALAIHRPTPMLRRSMRNVAQR